MEKVNIKLDNVTAFPLTKAIKGRKGDVIIISEDGETNIIPARVYKSLQDVNEFVRSGSKRSGLRKPSSRARYASPEEMVKARKDILEALRVGHTMLISDLVDCVDLPWLGEEHGTVPVPIQKQRWIYKCLHRLQKEGLCQHTEVRTNTNYGRGVVRQTLWALADNVDKVPCSNQELNLSGETIN